MLLMEDLLMLFYKKKPIKDALIFANKVAGLSTTKQGAGNAMPSLEEVNKLTN